MGSVTIGFPLVRPSSIVGRLGLNALTASLDLLLLVRVSAGSSPVPLLAQHTTSCGRQSPETEGEYLNSLTLAVQGLLAAPSPLVLQIPLGYPLCDVVGPTIQRSRSRKFRGAILGWA